MPKVFGMNIMSDHRVGSAGMTTMPGPSDPGPILIDNPIHGEYCPKCGQLTRRWFYEATTIYLECEHCGFKGQMNSTPVSGVRVDGTSRRVAPPRTRTVAPTQ